MGRMPFLPSNQQCQSTEGNQRIWNREKTVQVTPLRRTLQHQYGTMHYIPQQQHAPVRYGNTAVLKEQQSTWSDARVFPVFTFIPWYQLLISRLCCGVNVAISWHSFKPSMAFVSDLSTYRSSITTPRWHFHHPITTKGLHTRRLSFESSCRKSLSKGISHFSSFEINFHDYNMFYSCKFSFASHFRQLLSKENFLVSHYLNSQNQTELSFITSATGWWQG